MFLRTSCRHAYIYIYIYIYPIETSLERLCYDHVYRGIFVIPITGIYQAVSLEALLQPVHWHVFVGTIIDIYLCISWTVFLRLFWFMVPPLNLIYLCNPPLFLDTVTYGKKLLYFHSVDLYIRINLYYFCLQDCIVFRRLVY